MTELGTAILDTLTYHSLFDFPLTAQEICLTLPKSREGTQLAVIRELSALESGGQIDSEDGLWFLVGQESSAQSRKSRYNLAERKFRIAKRFFRIARHAPFLRAVYICNTLSRSNAKEGSDIDLFIVTAPGRIWLTRLFVTGLAKLLHARPNSTTAKDKICLSFFNTEDALNLRTHAIENDIYLPHWLFDLYPLYDESGISGKIFAENMWARDQISGLHRHVGSARRTIKGKKDILKKGLEHVLQRDVFENAAMRFQMRIMPKGLKENSREEKGVVINSTTLKLHGLDRRASIRDRYEVSRLAHRQSDISNSQRLTVRNI